MTARSVVATLGVAACFALAAAPASAATPSEASEAVREQGYFVEAGAQVDEARVARVAADAARAGLRLAPIAVADAPQSGATVFADGVLDRLGSGTVIVYAPGEIGYASTAFSRSTLDRAAASAVDEFRTDPTSGFVAFARALAGGARGAPAAGGFVSLFPLLLIGGFFLLMFAPLLRMRKAQRRANEENVHDARRELSAQLAVVADGILELADRVSASQDTVAKRHFAEASEAYATAERRLPEATSYRELASLTDRLDHARWQIEAARASLEGREPPREPQDEPGSCFFDPTHGAGTERAIVEGDEGRAEVRICRWCADQLRHGELPEPRTISVGGEEVPAGAAPRAFGGFGLGFLPGSFILPGMGAVMYDWGGRRSAVFGGGMFGLGGGIFGGGAVFGGGGGMRRRGRGGMRLGGRSRGGMRLGGRARGGRRL